MRGVRELGMQCDRQVLRPEVLGLTAWLAVHASMASVSCVVRSAVSDLVHVRNAVAFHLEGGFEGFGNG